MEKIHTMAGKFRSRGTNRGTPYSSPDDYRGIDPGLDRLLAGQAVSAERA